jgi:hypothetical protein
LYGSETLFLILNEEHRLRVVDNRAMRGVFGPEREEVTGGGRELHNELHDLYLSSDSIRMMN